MKGRAKRQMGSNDLFSPPALLISRRTSAID